MFSEYPKMMVHPGSQNAVLGFGPREGHPTTFPPVFVNTADQEAQYEAKGYIAKGGNVDHSSHEPRGYKFHEYPKWVNGTLVRNVDEESALHGASAKANAEVALIAPKRRGRPPKVHA